MTAGHPLGPTAQEILLDGQQRLTALFHAIGDHGPYVFAVRPSAFDATSIDVLEDSIIAVRRSTWDKRYRDTPWDDELLIPFYALRSQAEFFAWRDRVWPPPILDASGRDLQPMADLYNESLHRVHDYEFPVVDIEAPANKDDVARIFERVNRTGLLLNTFDLMVARVYEDRWNLRERWEDARLSSDLIDHFLSDDGMPCV